MKLLCEVHYEYIMGTDEIYMLSSLLAVQWALCTVISGHFKASIHRWLIESSQSAFLAAQLNVPNIPSSQRLLLWMP